jgi:hypothetical protein
VPLRPAGEKGDEMCAPDAASPEKHVVLESTTRKSCDCPPIIWSSAPTVRNRGDQGAIPQVWRLLAGNPKSLARVHKTMHLARLCLRAGSVIQPRYERHQEIGLPMTSERKQLENQIDELRRQFNNLLDSLNEDNGRDVGRKLKENLAVQDKLKEQRDQVLDRELANYTMTEQQRTEIVAALLRRFPKLATVEFEWGAIGKAMATIDLHTQRIARSMVIDDCTPTEAIATIDRLNVWCDADLTEPDK